MTISTPGSKVLVVNLVERDDLSDALGVGPLHNIQLVLSLFAKDNQVSITQTTDHDLSLFTSDSH